MPLSKKALEHKREYNRKRTKELYRKFGSNLKIKEYNSLCKLLNEKKMNKAEFIRWAFEELKKTIITK